MEKKKMSTKVMTPMFRVSYPYVLSPNSDGKYSVAMLFEKKRIKEDPAYREKFNALKSEIVRAGKEAFPNADEKVRLMPIKDGDKEKPGDEIYAGMLYCDASTQYEPEVFDQNRTDILSRKDFYAGCYARALVHCYAWKNTKSGDGISLGLDAVQKLADGEQIGEGGSKKAAFEDDDPDVMGAADSISESDDDLLL